jgi:glycosyltransferase involved in cell wall biosynthesis
MLMPVRNGARWLDEAVASVLVQTWTDLELVVVDDASIDATPEMLGEWCERDSRVRIVRRDAATGAVAARRDAVAARAVHCLP